MKRVTPLLLLIILVLQAVSPAAAAPVQLPDGAQVMLHAVQDVLSNKVKSGDVVDLVVSSPLKVKGATIVPAGAKAHASVAYNRGSGVGFGGELMLVIMDMQAADGSWIPLRATSAPGNGLSRIIPDDHFDRVAAPFPSGKNLRLSYKANFKAWVDGARTYDVTGSKVRLATPAPQRGKKMVAVPDGTVVTVHPTSELSSGQLNTGDRVDFLTTAPVQVNGATIIAQEAPAYGTVLLARKAGMGNKGGLLVLSIDRVKAVDGRELRLSSSSAGRGANNKAYSAAISLVVPIVGLAVEGRESVIHQDKELPVFTMMNGWVAVPAK